MALFVIARNSILLLFGWEIMALSAFFRHHRGTERRKRREAGWIYLVATHTATLALFALFALLQSVSGTFTLVPLDADKLTPAIITAIFVLTLIGFGVKAGIMPLHLWLPSSHAIAPSHVSAIMSGVIIKMGIYGIIRITSLLPNPPWQLGAILLGLGVVSGILGVVFAIGQHDIKRLLAYHSIENIGIIVIGIGLAMIGRSLNRSDLVILGMSGALLHVWNHAFFKALLFLSAGSVIHATHTREIDHMGGLAKLMPWTSICFLAGAVAICGLPPLNGFVSEFFIYIGLFNSLIGSKTTTFIPAAAAAPGLALIGALAVACFVKVYGAVFLGTPRTEAAQKAHESPWSMRLPMVVLVFCCFTIGLAPFLVVPMLLKAIRVWDPNIQDLSVQFTNLIPLGWVTGMGLFLTISLIVLGMIVIFQTRRNTFEENTTWGCGYVRSTPRIQYTSSSFAQMLVLLFAWVLRPRIHGRRVDGLFPKPTVFHSEVADPVLDEAVLPFFHYSAWLFSQFRVFQRGSIQSYLLYIGIAVIALLVWQ